MRNTWKAAETKTSLTCLLEALILNLCRDTNNFDWGGEGCFLDLPQLRGGNVGLGGLLDEDILFNVFLAIKIQDGARVSTFRMNRSSSSPGILAYVTVFMLRLVLH